MITQELICNKSCQRDCGNCVSACLAFSYPRRFPQVANRKLWIVYYLQVNFGSNLPFEVNIYILFKSNLSIRQRVSEETQEILRGLLACRGGHQAGSDQSIVTEHRGICVHIPVGGVRSSPIVITWGNVSQNYGRINDLFSHLNTWLEHCFMLVLTVLYLWTVLRLSFSPEHSETNW